MEEETYECQSNQQYIKHTKFVSELVSVKNKIIEPNPLLPGATLRSKLPKHILPNIYDFQSTNGVNMLLDANAYINKNQYLEKQNGLIKKQVKSKHVSTSHKKIKSNQMIFMKTHDIEQIEAQKQEYQYFKGYLKNLLKISNNIAFISQSVFIGEQKKYVSDQIINESDKKRKILEKILTEKQHFGSICLNLSQILDLKTQMSYPKNEDQQITFSDNFQSSNIYLAAKSPFQNQAYFIMTRFDYNTKSYGQWFYFKVKRSMKCFQFQKTKNNQFKFIISNMTKNSALFQKGLKVSVCRKGKWAKEGVGIKYYKNTFYRGSENQSDQINLFSKNGNSEKNSYFSLQFCVQILQGEQIYISYNQPYSYTRLGQMLDEISNQYDKNAINLIDFKRTVLCSTILGNTVQVITFMSNKNNKSEDIDEKKIIFIMARTHPIETAGSFVVEGILKQISQLFKAQTAQECNIQLHQLLKNYIIKIIPMVNPDGVIVGNSRCNLAGFDLNRVWNNPSAQNTCEIYFIKKYILLYQKRIAMFIDLHAHSKKKNVFAYGCHDFSNPFSTREFPFILSKLSSKDFLFEECRFTKILGLGNKNNQKKPKQTKQGTARIFLWNTLKTPNIFTIQNSYCCSKNSPFHYDSNSYQLIGIDILRAIAVYFYPTFQKQKQHLKKKQDKKDKKSINIQIHIPSSVDVSLKISTHSEFGASQSTSKVYQNLQNNSIFSCDSVKQKWLKELKSNQNNLSVGLVNDIDDSDSQIEERITGNQEGKKKKRGLAFSVFKKNTNSKTQKLINLLQPSAPITDRKKQQKQPQNVNLQELKQSKRNVSALKINKNLYQTIIKQKSSLNQTNEGYKNTSRWRKITLINSKPKLKQYIPLSQQKQENNYVSIVEIGNELNLGNIKSDIKLKIGNTHRSHLQNNEIKDKIRSTNTLHTNRLNREEIKNQKINKDRQQEIKQHLRKLMRYKKNIYCQQKRKEADLTSQKSKTQLKFAKLIAINQVHLIKEK